MENNKEYEVQKKNKAWKFIKKHLRGKVLVGLIIIVTIAAIALGLGSKLTSKQKTTDMGLNRYRRIEYTGRLCNHC